MRWPLNNTFCALADFEIFDIVDALEKAEGKDTNFYNWLGVAVCWSNNDLEEA